MIVIHLEENLKEIVSVNPSPELVVFIDNNFMALTDLDDVRDSFEFAFEEGAEDHLQAEGEFEQGRPLFDRLTPLGSSAQEDQCLDKGRDITPVQLFNLAILKLFDVILPYFEQRLQ